MTTQLERVQRSAEKMYVRADLATQYANKVEAVLRDNPIYCFPFRGRNLRWDIHNGKYRLLTHTADKPFVECNAKVRSEIASVGIDQFLEDLANNLDRGANDEEGRYQNLPR